MTAAEHIARSNALTDYAHSLRKARIEREAQEERYRLLDETMTALSYIAFCGITLLTLCLFTF